jgi:hypothetical protein
LQVKTETDFSKTGIYIPLYVYPANTGWHQWEILIRSKLAHPSVPFVVVINPSNGVGMNKDNNYVNGIKHLQSAGITVIGYVYTGYGTRDIDVVKLEIEKYRDWYDVDGIMFDEMSNKAGNETYYEILARHAKSNGMRLTKGNPGTLMPSSYTSTVDNFVIYENSGYPDLIRIKELHTDYNKKNLSFVSYGITILDTQYVIKAINYVGLMYITDCVLPNPYDSIPSYFENLVSILDT